MAPLLQSKTNQRILQLHTLHRIASLTEWMRIASSYRDFAFSILVGRLSKHQYISIEVYALLTEAVRLNLMENHDVLCILRCMLLLTWFSSALDALADSTSCTQWKKIATMQEIFCIPDNAVSDYITIVTPDARYHS